MKYISLFLILFLVNYSYSQKDYFTFEQLIEKKKGPIKMPFSVKNSLKNKAFLKQNKIKLKHETSNYLYCNGDADLFYQAQLNGKLEQVYFQVSHPIALTDSALIHHKGDLVHAGFGGLDTSYTGKEVIIGIVDRGLDYNHPDFKNTDGSTRVLRYWDHTVNDENHPNYFNYYDKGILWDSAAINSGTCTSLEVSTAHGSTVTGMAASNGFANGTNKGFAPQADLIVVESDFGADNWKLSIADACDYIFKVADSLGKPAVINLSLGSYFGSHDATDPAAELINSLLDEKAGRIVVSAAGNSGQSGAYHVGADVTEDTSFVWMISNPSNTWIGAPNTILIELWADTSDANFMFSYAADTPNPNFSFRGRTTAHNLSSDIANPIIIDTLLNNAGESLATIWTIREIVGGNLHAQIAFIAIDSIDYLYRFEAFGEGHYDLWGGSFLGHSDFVTEIPTVAELPAIADYVAPDTLQTIVDSWNCSEKVISVGELRNRMSHIDLNGNTYNASPGTAVGELSSASSKGPSRTGVQKPDISASGGISLASGPFSWLNDPAYAGSIDQGGFHIRNGGTSMAAPVVTGIAALYLQKCPGASYLDFKNDLTTNADVDSNTGAVPNFGYGYGKANALQTILAKHDPVIIDGPGGICPGEVATLGYNTNLIPTTTLWSNGAGSASITTAVPGDYQVVLENEMGCKSRSEIYPLISYSNPIVNAGNDYFICPNSTLTLLATGTATNYLWNNDVVQGQEFIPLAGTYIVNGTNSSGCTASDTTIIELLSTLPIDYNETITLIGINQTAFNLTEGIPSGGIYSGEGVIGNSFHPGLAGIGIHAVTYSITDGNGCIVTDTSFIEVFQDAGLENTQTFNLSVAPNPFNKLLNIQITEPVNIIIYDLKGKIMLKQNLQHSQAIFMKNIAPGTYLLKAINTHKSMSLIQRIVKYN